MVLLTSCTPNIPHIVSSIVTSTPVSSAAGWARLAASVAVLYVYARVRTVSYAHCESKLHSSMDNAAVGLQVRPERDTRQRTTCSTDSCKKEVRPRALS